MTSIASEILGFNIAESVIFLNSAQFFSVYTMKTIFFQFENIILVSSFRFIWIPMLWFYGRYNCFNYFSAGIDFRRQNLRLRGLIVICENISLFIIVQWVALLGFKYMDMSQRECADIWQGSYREALTRKAQVFLYINHGDQRGFFNSKSA